MSLFLRILGGLATLVGVVYYSASFGAFGYVVSAFMILVYIAAISEKDEQNAK